jgi:hypothetical protein
LPRSTPAIECDLDFCLAPQNLELSTFPPYRTPSGNRLEWESYVDANGVINAGTNERCCYI